MTRGWPMAGYGRGQRMRGVTPQRHSANKSLSQCESALVFSKTVGNFLLQCPDSQGITVQNLRDAFVFNLQGTQTANAQVTLDKCPCTFQVRGAHCIQTLANAHACVHESSHQFKSVHVVPLWSVPNLAHMHCRSIDIVYTSPLIFS